MYLGSSMNGGYNMPYNTNISPYQPMNINTQQLIRVNGLEGAKAYQMGANSTVALFDGSEDIMYIKQTDGAGFPSIRTFSFSEINQDSNKVKQDYVTRKELEEYVEHIISKSTLNAEPTAEIQPTTDK